MATSTTSCTTLVVGATGATGRHVVKQLLDRGHSVRAIVRSEERLMDALRSIASDNDDYSKLSVTEASLLDLSDDDLMKNIQDCDAVVSCLGHNMTFSGMFGEPRHLVADAAQRLCAAFVKGRKQESEKEKDGAPVRSPGKFILMGSDGVANPNSGDDVRPLSERVVLGLIRALVPPHRDNEAAAALLHDKVGKKDKLLLEWSVVRPVDLIDGDVSKYKMYDKPQGSLFGSGEATRANVANGMVELIVQDDLWEEWKFKMPVLINESEK